MEVGTAVVICRALLRTVLSAKEMWDQRNGNTEVAEELTAFIRDLQVNEKTLDAKQLGTNNTSTWSMAALREDLEKANQGAQHILKKGFIEKMWNSNKIKEELRVLRERVMTSFQVKLLFTTLDVTLDNSKNQRKFQAAMSRVQQELNRTHAETSAANLREIKNAIRRELQLMWQPVQTEMRAQGKSVEGAIGVIKGTGFQAQTDDTEKFFADVLMELENAMKDSLPASASTSGGGEGGSSKKSKADLGLVKWYHDPITWDIMCDPVKASDRRTYDRWTLLNNSSSMKRSPFDRDQEQQLKVEFDDVDVRSRLFHKFPEQEGKCKARRREYREEALRKACEGFVADALVMLNHVLDWAGEDSECRAKRDEIAGLVSRDLTLDTGGALESLLAVDTGGALENLLAVDTGGGLESLLAVDTRFLDTTKVAISRDNLTVTTLTDAAVCFRTTSPCPPGSSFYFEMQVKNAGAKGRVAVGFSAGAAFKPDRLPGLYPASWAYLGYDDPLTATAGRVVKGREPLCPNDTVGAGLLHKSRHIYFIHNGALLGAVAVDAGTDLAQLFPTVGLARRDAKVTLNFGRGRDFMTQHMPTRLDRESCSTDALGAGFISISPQGTEAQFWGRDEVLAVRADSPAPCRFPSYYFELQVMQDAGPYGWMGIGFTASNLLLPFRSDRQKKSFSDGLKTGSGPSFTAGDTLGAGIFYGTDEFFFRKNGVIIGSFSRSSSTVLDGGLLFPTVALHSPVRSPCACVRLNFGATSFVPAVLPSRLNFVPGSHVPARAGPVLAAQADHSVPVGTDFYFEMELGSGTLQQENWQVAIGFANLENFCSNKQPGVYAGSCGYHQDGGLYCGGRLQPEHACGGFGAGDTVGAGVLRRRNILFFTRNGDCVASVDYLSVFSQLQVYPTVGMTSLDEQALRIHFFDDVERMSSRIPEGIQSPTRSIPAPAPTRALARLPSRLLRSLSSPQISSTEAHSKRSPWSPGFLFFEPSKPAQNPYVIP